MHPKKVRLRTGTQNTFSRRKTNLFKRIGKWARAGSRAGRKARKSGISGLSPTAMARSRQGDFGTAGREKRPPQGPAAGVDSKARQWHSAVTGHAMTVAVGDGRGFSSLAAAPDGRAPARCTARSWPGAARLRNEARKRSLEQFLKKMRSGFPSGIAEPLKPRWTRRCRP